MFRDTCLIYGIELLAMVSFFEDQAPSLKGCIGWIYMGNNNCLDALVGGAPIPMSLLYWSPGFSRWCNDTTSAFGFPESGPSLIQLICPLVINSCLTAQ